MQKTILIDTKKTVLSSSTTVYKTGGFLKQSQNFFELDLFLYKVAEGLILNFNELFSSACSSCFRIETEDKAHAFFFVLGAQIQSKTTRERDIIFVRYSGKEAFIRKNDRSLSQYLMLEEFPLHLEDADLKLCETETKKLYRLSNSSSVSFPLLDEVQNEILSIENQNVLVQGVAGSGKTNLCIDKLVFTACRGYRGRVLYTTYSRGLLVDTKQKVLQFVQNLKTFEKDYLEDKIIFADSDKRRAIENKLGIYFSQDDSTKILKKVQDIIFFLENNVDYFMLEDFYNLYLLPSDSQKVITVDEQWFSKTFVSGLKNHQLVSKLEKIAYLTYEVIYKEIFGVIFGCYDLDNPTDILPLEDYIEKRKDSFTRAECETIYWLARDYDAYLKKNNLLDNNLIARMLLERLCKLEKYSLAIVDEVQDMTEVCLSLLRCMTMKMFCVGDALQMINPSFFSFAYLKRLLFEQDIISVRELKSNYRNTKKIAELIDRLGNLNTQRFGTHSFVLKTESMETEVATKAVYLKDKAFLERINHQDFNNYTIIVPSLEIKHRLRKTMPKQEILTVSEIKGLERDVIILYNVLSSNIDKWRTLERLSINRKNADENSVYRYYFNLFYVGLSRGKTHIYVVESESVQGFKQFFKDNFEHLAVEDAVTALKETSDKTEAEQDELIARVNEFIKLGQFDNARFTLGRIISTAERELHLQRIDIHETLVRRGDYRAAGVRLWELGLLDEARGQFMLSKDGMLISLMDACAENKDTGLDISIIEMLPDLQANEPAKQFVMDVLNKDYVELKARIRQVSEKFKNFSKVKGDRKNGKGAS